MTIRTQLKAGGTNLNHNEALKVRTSLKAGGVQPNHNEALKIRTALKAGSLGTRQSGGSSGRANHNETLKVRTALKAGGVWQNHNEALRRVTTRLRRFAIAALAAATVTVGSLAPVPTASAMPRSCVVSLSLAQTYTATGNVFYAIGAYQQAQYWWGKAAGLIEACA